MIEVREAVGEPAHDFGSGGRAAHAYRHHLLRRNLGTAGAIEQAKDVCAGTANDVDLVVDDEVDDIVSFEAGEEPRAG